MAGLTVGTLVAVLQLRAEQFLTANRQAQAGLKATAAEAQATGAATERTDAALAGLGASAGRAGASLRDTSGALIAATGTTDRLTIANERLRTAQLQVVAAQERYDAVMATGTATTGEQAAATARLTAAQTRVAVAANESAAALARSGEAATAAAAQTSAAASTQAGAATRTLGSVASTVAKTGALLGGVALVFSVAEIAKNGNEFTHAMNTLGAASGAAAPQLEAARQQAIAMGKDLTIPKVTATDAAVAMEDLVKAGVSLDRAMSAARPALLLAAAANVSVADSARVTGDLLDEWGFSADKATHVADVMASAANSAGGGLMDLFGAMKYVGPSARQLGVGFDYTTAALVELAKAGIQGSMAGTSLRNMLTRLTPQGAPATKALNDLGVSAFDASGHFKGLPTVVDQLHGAMERLSPQRFAADVSAAFGSRALAAVQIFAHGGEVALQGFFDKVEGNNVQAIADKMNQGVGAGFAQLGKEFSAVGLDIYNVVQGPLSTAVHWIGEELPRAFDLGKAVITEIRDDARSLTPVWSAVSSVFSTSSRVLGAVFGLLSQHTGTLRVLGEAAAGAWLAFKGYGVVMVAAAAVRSFGASTAASMAAGTASVRQYATNFAAVMTGTEVVATESAAAVTAAEAEKAASAARSTAVMADAAAIQAEAMATVSVAAGETAVAMRAAATQAQVTAATMTVAAEEAAAGVAAAGEVAAVGWRAMLGPVGLVVAALSFVALGFHHSGAEARKSSIDVDSLTQAIQRDSGALGENTRQQIANTLHTDGAFDSAKKLGIGTDVLTDAVVKGGSAMGDLKGHLQDIIAAQLDTKAVFEDTNYSRGYGEASQAGDDLTATARSLLDELNGVSGGLTKAQQDASDMATAMGTAGSGAASTAAQLDELKQKMGETSVATDAASMASARGNAAVLAYTTAANAMQQALGGDKTAAQGLSDAIAALNGTLSSNQARDSFLDAQAQLKAALDASSGSLDFNNEKGRAADEAFNSAVTAAQQYAIAQTQVTNSIPAGIDAYNQQINALLATAAQSGATAGQMDALKASVDSVPELKQILTQVLGDKEASSDLGKIKAAIDALRDKTIRVTVLQNTALGAIAGTSGIPETDNPPLLVPHANNTGQGHTTGGHAGGGLINAPGNGLRDTVLSPVANREFVQRAAAVNKFGVPFMSAVNQGDAASAMTSLAQQLGLSISGSRSTGPTQADPAMLAALDAIHDAVYDTGGRTVDAIGQHGTTAMLRGVSTVSGRPY